MMAFEIVLETLLFSPKTRGSQNAADEKNWLRNLNSVIFKQVNHEEKPSSVAPQLATKPHANTYSMILPRLKRRH